MTPLSRVLQKASNGAVHLSKRVRRTMVAAALGRDAARRKQEGIEPPPFNPKRGLNITVKEDVG